MNTSFPSVSLYVGDLAAEVSESHLFEIFNLIGPVALIRVCRDASARRRSLGYAYVNFYNHSDAERALNTLNNTPIKGKPCRIMWSQRDSSERNSGVGNVYIKNLAHEIDHKALHDLFAPFGSILSFKIALDDSNASKGYGFVQFETEENANKAIEALNGTHIQGKEVFVGHFIPRKDRQPSVEETFTNLYVKNLDDNVDEQKLREIFGSFGELTSVAVMTEADGKSKGFGFINFADHQQALAAVEALNNTVLVEGGKNLFVGKAQKRAERDAELRHRFDKHRRPAYANHNNSYNHSYNTNNNHYHHNTNNNEPRGFNVYLKNLDPKVEEQKLREEFGKLGTVSSVKVVRDEKGISKGYGFVTYKTYEEAQKAVTEMRGKLIEGKNIYVAHRKDMRNRDNQNPRQKSNRWTQNPGQNNNKQQQQSTRRSGKQGGRVGSSQENATASPSNSSASTAPTAVASPAPVKEAKDNDANTTTATNATTTTTTSAAATTTPTTTTNPSSVEELLAQVPLEHQIQAVAERLYPLIDKTQGAEIAGKVTGMLMDRFPKAEDLAVFIFDEKALNEKVAEASQILKQANENSEN